MDQQEVFEAQLLEWFEQTTNLDIETTEATAAVDNLKKLASCMPREFAPNLTPDPVPVTAWEKFKAGLTKVWESETTRVALKAGGSLAGVGMVVYSTVHRDHVLERNALNQANQHNS